MSMKIDPLKCRHQFGDKNSEQMNGSVVDKMLDGYYLKVFLYYVFMSKEGNSL